MSRVSQDRSMSRSQAEKAPLTDLPHHENTIWQPPKDDWLKVNFNGSSWYWDDFKSCKRRDDGG